MKAPGLVIPITANQRYNLPCPIAPPTGIGWSVEISNNSAFAITVNWSGGTKTIASDNVDTVADATGEFAPIVAITVGPIIAGLSSSNGLSTISTIWAQSPDRFTDAYPHPLGFNTTVQSSTRIVNTISGLASGPQVSTIGPFLASDQYVTIVASVNGVPNVKPTLITGILGAESGITYFGPDVLGYAISTATTQQRLSTSFFGAIDQFLFVESNGTGPYGFTVIASSVPPDPQPLRTVSSFVTGTAGATPFVLTVGITYVRILSATYSLDPAVASNVQIQATDFFLGGTVIVADGHMNATTNGLASSTAPGIGMTVKAPVNLFVSTGGNCAGLILYQELG